MFRMLLRAQLRAKKCEPSLRCGDCSALMGFLRTVRGWLLAVFAFVRGSWSFQLSGRKRAVDAEAENVLKTREEFLRLVRNPYSPSGVPEHIDVIVIGSGIGGLTCAGLLARAGRRVVVLEQHDVLGGCLHQFRRGSLVFDTGVHYVGDDERLTKLVDELTIGKTDWARVGVREDGSVVHDEIVVKGLSSVEIRGARIDDSPAMGTVRWKEGLLEQFPDEEAAIEKFLCLSEEALRRSKLFFALHALPRFVARLLEPLVLFRMSSFMRPAMEVIMELTANPKLIGILCHPWSLYGLSCDNVPFMFHACVLFHYMVGGLYPSGGSQLLAARMVAFLQAHGCVALTRARVAEVVLDDRKRVAGVRMANEQRTVHKCSSVVSTIGVIRTFKDLLSAHKDESFSPTMDLAAVKPSIGHVCVFVGIRGSAKALGLSSTFVFLESADDHVAMREKYLSQPAYSSVPYALVTFGAKDPVSEELHPGRTGAVLLSEMNYAWLHKWRNTKVRRRGGDYEALKAQVGADILELMFERYPQLRELVDFVEVSTPLSTEFYLQAAEGCSYGLDHTCARFGFFRELSPASKVPGLYFAGQDVCSSGVLGAATGAYECALHLMGFSQYVRNLLVLNDWTSKEEKRRGLGGYSRKLRMRASRAN